MTDHDYADIGVSTTSHVTTVEIRRPPNNFFDQSLIGQIADAFDAADEDPDCRAIVLAADGKHFCAGANFGTGRDDKSGSSDFTEEGFRNTTGKLYREAAKLFGNKTMIVGAIHGAAIGGGLDLALVPDFRRCSGRHPLGGGTPGRELYRPLTRKRQPRAEASAPRQINTHGENS